MTHPPARPRVLTPDGFSTSSTRHFVRGAGEEDMR